MGAPQNLPATPQRSDSQNSTFSEITDRDTIRNILDYCLNKGVLLSFWTQGAQMRFASKFGYRTKKLLYCDFAKDTLDNSNIPTKLKSHLKKPIYFHLSIQSRTFYCSTHLEDLDNTGFGIDRKIRIFKLQRRHASRMKLSYKNPVFMRLQRSENSDKSSEHADLRILDLSPKGAAIAISPHYLKVAERIARGGQGWCSFYLGKHLIESNLTIRNQRYSRDESGLEVVRWGIQFESMKKETLQLIEEFILKETRSIFSKLGD